MISKIKQEYYLSLCASFLSMVVIGLGAYTRLKHAGLGCPDWPGCYGFLIVPETTQDIIKATTLYPDVLIEVEKSWTEMIHRYVASLLLLIVLSIAVMAIYNRKDPNQQILLPVLILGLIIIQIIFGMWTITLKLWPQIVTAHLLGGFATCSLLFLLTLRLSELNWRKLSPSHQKNCLRTLAATGLAVVILQITLGGWTSSNYAALACPDFPMCQQKWLPPINIADGFNISQQSIGPNYLGGTMDSEARTAIHILHRIGAAVTFILLLVLFFKTIAYSRTQKFSACSNLKIFAYTILLALLVQVFLGITNILEDLPVLIAVAHNLGGAILLLTLVALNFRLNISDGSELMDG